jgi:hypothetical protein
MVVYSYYRSSYHHHHTARKAPHHSSRAAAASASAKLAPYSNKNKQSLPADRSDQDAFRYYQPGEEVDDTMAVSFPQFW